uniref:Arrestin_C domain-containing protein n=1 Tax=Caenorhabditis tropicalis TaxID=1561998 RepID=A0A1I7TLY8_9PELO
MVQLDRFEIVFNNPEEAYFAGQEISGKVIIENKEPKKVNEILLELKGRARTYWTKHSGKSRKHCSHSEPYFLEQFNTGYTHKFTIVNDGKEKERVLPAGIHQVPFSYTLPKSLPSSFEGEFGHIRYTCKAICERPWDFDIVSRKAFTVVGIEDINSDPKLNEPVTCIESNHAVTFCCRSTGSVTGEIKIPKCGFTPGEKIDVSFKVINLSSKTRNMALRFVQQTTYKAKTFAGHEHIKTVVRIISKIDKGEVPGGTTTEWQEEAITIPSLPPKLGKCKILSVTYSVEFEVEQTLTVPCSIVIGSIPQLSQLLIHSKQSVQSSGNGSIPKSSIKDSPPKWDSESCVQVTITDESGQLVEELGNEMEALLSSRKRVRMPSSILSELYPTMPSPYYKESFFGASDISEEKEQAQFGEISFAPKYPFYTD